MLQFASQVPAWGEALGAMQSKRDSLLQVIPVLIVENFYAGCQRLPPGARQSQTISSRTQVPHSSHLLA